MAHGSLRFAHGIGLCFAASWCLYQAGCGDGAAPSVEPSQDGGVQDAPTDRPEDIRSERVLSAGRHPLRGRGRERRTKPSCRMAQRRGVSTPGRQRTGGQSSAKTSSTVKTVAARTIHRSKVGMSAQVSIRLRWSLETFMPRALRNASTDAARPSARPSARPFS